MKASRRIGAAAWMATLAGATIFACGESSSDDSASPDSGMQGDVPTIEASGGDAQKTDSSAMSDASSDADAGPNALAKTFFGLTTNTLGAAHVPSVPFGAMRLWDTTAVWGLMNTGPGTYDFTALDNWLDEAQTAGVDVIFTFGRTPTWASADAGDTGCGYEPGSCLPPNDVQSGDTILKNFVTALVNHSKARTTNHIAYYEIWNEPDLGTTWANLDAPDLVTIGKDIYETVHALDSTARVIGPSPSTGNKFGIHFLPAYYAAGGAPYQDVVGLHAYLYDGSDFATAPEGILDTIPQLRSLMSANGVGDKPIFFTEGAWGGAPTNPA